MIELLENMGPSPLQYVFQGRDGKWYFWDELWGEKYGPYATHEEAVSECEFFLSMN